MIWLIAKIVVIALALVGLYAVGVVLYAFLGANDPCSHCITGDDPACPKCRR